MVLLSRLLPKRLLTVFLAARSTRQQARQSDDLGIVAVLAAIAMALWTFRKERVRSRREGVETGMTLDEYLDR